MRRVLRMLGGIAAKLDAIAEKQSLLERDIMNLRFRDTAGVRVDYILSRHFIVLPPIDKTTRLYDRDAINRVLDELPTPMAISDFTRNELLDLLVKIGRLKD